jgi:hypothetical protein
MEKLIAILIIFAGEAIAIAAEVFAARHYSSPGSSFHGTFFRVLPFIILGSSILLGGYMFGLAKFKNIWVVSAISITSILFLEPLIDYIVGGQLPTRGAIIGLIFGTCGFAASLFL